MGMGGGTVAFEQVFQRGQARERTPCGKGEQDREQPYRDQGCEGT
jgi:hypothetical protein